MNKTWTIAESCSCMYPACDFCKECQGDDEDDQILYSPFETFD